MAKQSSGVYGPVKPSSSGGQNSGGSNNGFNSSNYQNAMQTSPMQNKPSTSSGYNPKAIYGNKAPTVRQYIRDQMDIAARKAGKDYIVPGYNYSSGARGQALIDINAWSTMADHVTSGVRDTELTHQYLEEANARARDQSPKRFDEDTRSSWLAMANDLGLKLYNDFKAELTDLDTADKNNRRMKTDAENMTRAATADLIKAGYLDVNGSLIDGVNVNDDKYKRGSNRQNFWRNRVKNIDADLAANEARRADIMSKFVDYLATPEEREALEAYKKNDYGDPRRLILGDAGGRPDFLPDRKDKVEGNGRDKAADYALIQGLYNRLGMEVPPLNDQEIWASEIGGRIEHFAGALVSAASTSEANANRAADVVLGNEKATGWDVAYNVLNGGHSVLQGLGAKARDKLTGAGEQRQIGALNSPADGEIDKLWEAYNKAPVSWEHGEKDQILDTLMAGASAWTKNAESMQAQYDKNAARIEEIAKMTDVSDPAMIAKLDRETQELGRLNHQLEKDIKDARVIADKYTGNSPNYWWALRSGTAEDRAAAIQQLAWKLDNEGAKNFSAAEAASGPIQRKVLQTAGTITEIGFDAAVAAITKTDPRFVMGLRVLGSSRNEGLKRGWSEPKAALFGYANATAEIAAEGMGELAGGVIYGESAAGEFVGELARRLTDNPAFRKWIMKGGSVFGEGAEEGATDFAAIPIEMIFDYNKDQSFWENLKGKSAQELATIWEDMLMGSLVALLGIPVGDITGSYNQQVADTYAADLMQDEAAHQQIINDATSKIREAARGNVNPIVSVTQSANAGGTRELTKKNLQETTKTAEEEAITKLAERSESDTSITKAANKYRNIINKYGVTDESGNIIGLKTIPEDERLTKQESDMLSASGLLPKEVKAMFTGATEKEKRKAARAAGESKNISDITRDKIIERAEKLDVGQKEAAPRPLESRTEEAPEHEPGAGGSKEYEAELAAKAAEGQKAIDEGKTDNQSLAKVVPAVDAAISSGKTVKAIKESIFENTGKEGEPSLLDKVSKWMEKTIGGRVFTRKIGGENGTNIILDNRGISQNANEENAAIFQAVPEVLRNGQIVSTTKENDEAVSYIIAGKVNLMGKPVNVYCVVEKDGDGFRLKEVSDGTGNVLYQLKEDGNAKGEQKTAPSTSKEDTPKKTSKRTAEEKAAANKRMFDGMRRNIEDTYSAEDLETSKRLYDEKSSELEGLKEGDTLHSKDGGETAVVVFADDEGVGIRVFDEDGNELAYDRIPKGYMPKSSPYMTYNLAPDSTTPKETGIIDSDAAESATPQETHENAPQGQAAEEGTPVAPAEEKSVKPDVKLAESEGGINGGERESKATKDIDGLGVLKGTNENDGGRPGVQGSVSEMGEGVGILGNDGQLHKQKELTDKGKENLKKACEKIGLEESDLLPEDQKPDSLSEFEDISGGPISIGLGGSGGTLGLASQDDSADSYNILLALNDETAGKLGHDAAHETGHRRILARKGKKIMWFSRAFDAALKSKTLSHLSYDQRQQLSADVFGSFTKAWAEDYCKDLGRPLTDDEITALENKPLKDAVNYITDILDKDDPTLSKSLIFKWWMNHEVTLELLSHNDQHFKAAGIDSAIFDALCDEGQAQLVKENIFSDTEISRINKAIWALNSQSRVLYKQLTQDKANKSAKGEQPAKSRPVPTGTRKQHNPNVLEQKTQSYGSRVEHYTRMDKIAEKFGTDDGTFLSKTREEVSRIADYCIEEFGAEPERERLMNTKDWTRLDFSIAGKIAYDMTVKLNDEMTALGNKGLGKNLERKDGESWSDYQRRQAEEDKREFLRRREPIDALLQMYEQQKSEAGQKLQEQYKFSTADEIRMKASQRLLSYTVDGEVTNSSDKAKNAKIYAIISDLLNRAEAADTKGDMKEMAEIAKLTAQIRGRENLFGKAGTKAENAIFDDLLKAGLEPDKMAALTYGNIKKILDDLTPITYMDALNTIRMSNMLSNVATGVNNFKNNAVALRLGALAQNAAYPFAKAFEKITGKKIAFTDTSFTRIGGGKMRAEITAYEYALLSAYYGINQEQGRFDVRSANAGFNINGEGIGGVMGRNLARYNFLINALVLSPDAPAKARVEHAMRQGIERAFEGVDMTKEMAANKKELEAYAHNESLRRTLQDDNRLTNDVMWVKKRLNKHETRGKDLVINGRQLGSIKLGDFAMAFAKVPANVGYQKVMATPFGAAYQMLRYADGLARARINPESMSTIEMAKLSRDIGRAATTWGMIALGALGAMTGALKNFDDTDDDEEKKLAAEKGYRGLTFNVNALFRKGNEWKENDKVVSGSFLEILAMPLAIGAIMYDASQEGIKGPKLLWKGTVDGFAGMVDAVMDIPGLQQFSQIYEAYANNRNPDEDLFTKGAKAVGQFVVNSGTSYVIPNIVSQVGAGLDNKQRDVYGVDTYPETLRNIVMSKIPGVRTLLPEKTDTFGNTRTYGDNQLMALINTVLLPGDIKKYHISDLETEMLRLKEATGYKGTIFDTKAPKSIKFDDEEYALDADNGRAYHDAKAKCLLEAYDKFRNSDVYDKLTDDQKLAVVMQLRTDAERMTRNGALKLAGVDENKLNDSLDKWERDLKTWDEKIDFLSTKQMVEGIWDKDNNTIGDYAAMDKFIKEQYPGLSKTQKDLLDNTYSRIDDIYSASKVGIDAKTYAQLDEVHSKYEDMQDYYREVDLDDEPSQTALARNMIVEYENIVKDPKQREWAQKNMQLWMHMPVNIQSLEKWQEKTNLETKEIDSWFDTKESAPIKGGYKELSQNQRFQLVRDFTGITASNQQDLEKKRWEMIEQEASHGEDKDGDGEGDGGAWAKLKPFRDAGYPVAYALKHAVYWYTPDFGKHWQKRSYNKIYPSDK